MIGAFLQNLGLNLLGDAVTAGADSLGITPHGRDQYFNANLQREFLERQIEFQREQTGVSQDFSREMYAKQVSDMMKNYPELMRQARQEQFALWNQEFNAQNRYNLPEKQVERLLAAGLNPNSVYGSGASASNSFGASSLPTPTPQVNATPAGSFASPVGLPQGAWAPAQNMSDVAQMAKDFAAAEKLGVESNQLKDLFDLEVQERVARIYGQRLSNDAVALSNYVQDKIKDKKIQKSTYELLEVMANTNYIDAKTTHEYEKIFNTRAEKLLIEAKKRLTDEEFELFKLRVDNFQEEFDTTMKNIRSDTAKNDSVTRLNNAIRETENQLREYKVTCLDLGNKHQEIANELAYKDLWVKNRTLDAEISGLIHSWQREGIINQQEAEKLYQMSVSSDWAEREHFINYVRATAEACGTVMSGSGSALSGYGSYKNAKWNNLNYNERNRITEEIGKERNRILDEYQKNAASTKRSAVLGPDWEMYSDQWSR